MKQRRVEHKITVYLSDLRMYGAVHIVDGSVRLLDIFNDTGTDFLKLDDVAVQSLQRRDLPPTSVAVAAISKGRVAVIAPDDVHVEAELSEAVGQRFRIRMRDFVVQGGIHLPGEMTFWNYLNFRDERYVWVLDATVSSVHVAGLEPLWHRAVIVNTSQILTLYPPL